MESGAAYFIHELAQALTGGVRLILLAGLPLPVVVSILALTAYLRGRPFSASMRPWLETLALLQAIGAAIVLAVDAVGLLTAPWEFEYLAKSFPAAVLFVVPLGVLTAPLWLFVLRRVGSGGLVSVVPRA